tara:strand:+ start:913 stop:1086 length:174 start_codon:yes stop_codon:yes gene_type:complete
MATNKELEKKPSNIILNVKIEKKKTEESVIHEEVDVEQLRVGISANSVPADLTELNY